MFLVIPQVEGAHFFMKQIMNALVCLVLAKHTDVSCFRAVQMTFSPSQPNRKIQSLKLTAKIKAPQTSPQNPVTLEKGNSVGLTHCCSIAWPLTHSLKILKTEHIKV